MPCSRSRHLVLWSLGTLTGQQRFYDTGLVRQKKRFYNRDSYVVSPVFSSFLPFFSLSVFPFFLSFFLLICFVDCWVFIEINLLLPQPNISPPDKHGWGRRFLLGLGREVQSLSRGVVIIMKIKIALLCFDRTRMLGFHIFLSFFAGRLSVLEDVDEESCLIETMLF